VIGESLQGAGVGVGGLAAVVGDAVALLADHAPAAEGAVDVGAQQVGAPGHGMGVRLAALPGALGPAPPARRLLEQLAADQRLVRGLGRPDPHRAIVGPAPGTAPVPDRVAGVLGLDRMWVRAPTVQTVERCLGLGLTGGGYEVRSALRRSRIFS
jgi:hypothetical protein